MTESQLITIIPIKIKLRLALKWLFLNLKNILNDIINTFPPFKMNINIVSYVLQIFVFKK